LPSHGAAVALGRRLDVSPRFPSKVDWWLGAILGAAPVVTLVAGWSAIAHGHLLLGVLPTAVLLAIYGGLVFPMYYELGDDALIIRFGLARSRVPYRSIRAVRPTGNPLSSPALSLDRLHVDAGSALGPNISPADRSGFLDALAQRTPHLRREGDSLVPA
jgi:hypothetical protein